MCERMDHSVLTVEAIQPATAARYISEETVKIHQGFGGWSQFNDQRARFEYPKPYLNLEALLKTHVQSIPGIDSTEGPWTGIYDKLTESEKEWSTTNKGAKAIFSNVLLKIGDNKQMIDPWISLIPDSYGLAVVKTGVAVLLKLAAKYAEKRAKIFATFEGIRTAIVEVNYKRRSFHTDPQVSICAGDLYVAIVEAVESLLRSLSTKRCLDCDVDSQSKSHLPRQNGPFRILSHFGSRNKVEDPETALQNIRDKAKMLQMTIDQRRDEKIGDIERFSRDTHSEIGVMRWNQKQTEINTRAIHANVQIVRTGVDGITSDLDEVNRVAHRTETVVRKVSSGVLEVKAGLEAEGRRHDEIMHHIQRENQRFREFASIQTALMNDSLEAKNNMLEVLLEDRRKKEMQIEQLQQRLRATQISGRPRSRSSTAVVSVTRLFALLAQPASHGAQSLSYEEAFQHPNNDLETIMGTGNTFTLQVQAQAQSVLQHPRFIEWMNHDHPDILLVDANLGSFALDTITPMSLFCATFILTMAKVQPNEILTHFFCGLHSNTSSSKDPWTGPSGLIRSLIFQILTSLHQRNLLSIEFINSRKYLKNLEDHDLPTLCETLHRLIRQFPPDVTVYCILDGVSSFDKDFQHSFQQFQVIIDGLQTIVEDDMLRCRFKVLLTNADQSTRRLRQVVDPSQHVTLSSRDLSLQMISDRSVAECIPRVSTPSVFEFSVSEEWGEEDEGFEW